MPRVARKKSRTGIYHVMLRGVDRQQIFDERNDYEKLLQLLKKQKEADGFKVYAYCIMSNHVHLLLKEGAKSLSGSIKVISASYAIWYNVKNDRVGHLFQSRFKSEVVETPGSLLRVVRYIHRNPVKAGICQSVSHYKYSSFPEYIFGRKEIIDYDEIMKFQNKTTFIKYNETENDDEFMDIPEKRVVRFSDENALELIYCLTECRSVTEFQRLTEEDKVKNIKLLREKGMSVRQLNRLTGVNRRKITKICA